MATKAPTTPTAEATPKVARKAANKVAPTKVARVRRTVQQPAQQNFAGLALILGLVLVAVLAFVFGAAVAQPAPKAAEAPVAAATEPADSSSPQEPAANPSTADAVTYKVEKNHAWVYASDGSLLAEVIAPTGTDLSSEWLKDREGVHYLFQSGINRKVELTVTLYKGAAFAIDGDWMQFNGMDLGIIDNSADFRAIADAPDTYKFTASSFGLAIGPYRADDDKAGFVLADRRSADNFDNRPEYWLDPAGNPVQIGQ